jgi:hypothetical protein
MSTTNTTQKSKYKPTLYTINEKDHYDRYLPPPTFVNPTENIELIQRKYNIPESEIKHNKIQNQNLIKNDSNNIEQKIKYIEPTLQTAYYEEPKIPIFKKTGGKPKKQKTKNKKTKKRRNRRTKKTKT